MRRVWKSAALFSRVMFRFIACASLEWGIPRVKLFCACASWFSRVPCNPRVVCGFSACDNFFTCDNVFLVLICLPYVVFT
ncbi:hypothetical protein PF008_g28492 [Phytophthora fragariae]|uniref:Secreted protein n=1 Tax=Phytophthora fragariae TaxID=53985 RepID=A0A6G0QB67_9STRA|nr:hypothetical protein PF008_g28492 [Phytophthora fragariae]